MYWFLFCFGVILELAAVNHNDTTICAQGERAFLTGDLGVLNTEGVLRITGRIKEQYVRKSLNGNDVFMKLFVPFLTDTRESFMAGTNLKMANMCPQLPSRVDWPSVRLSTRSTLTAPTGTCLTNRKKYTLA